MLAGLHQIVDLYLRHQPIDTIDWIGIVVCSSDLQYSQALSI